MKLILLFVIIISLGFSCNNMSIQTNDIVLGDTIQTESGLQYFYVKKGTGPKVEPSCEVKTYLSLKVNDSVVWTTDESPDTLFTFIAGFSRLIKGFTEMAMLLNEGDEVVAILPDSLAYGAKGAGNVIPPHATLVYDRFEVVKVGKPKAILADTLFETLVNSGKEEMIKKYTHITSGIDSNYYHTDIEQLYGLCDKLNINEKYQEAVDIASYFATHYNNDWLRYKMVMSLDSLGQVQQAVDTLELMLKKDAENHRYKAKLAELKEVLVE